MINAGLVAPKFLISIEEISELRSIENKDDSIRIGAAVTHREVASYVGLLGSNQIIREAAAVIAHPRFEISAPWAVRSPTEIPPATIRRPQLRRMARSKLRAPRCGVPSRHRTFSWTISQPRWNQGDGYGIDPAASVGGIGRSLP